MLTRVCGMCLGRCILPVGEDEFEACMVCEGRGTMPLLDSGTEPGDEETEAAG